NQHTKQNLIEVRDRNRLPNGVLSRPSSARKVTRTDKFGIASNLPASYQLAQADENVLRLRQPTPTPDRADIRLFFYQTDYVSEEQLFPENIIKLKDGITKERIFGDPANKNSFIETQQQSIPSFRNIEIDGHYAIELR